MSIFKLYLFFLELHLGTGCLLLVLVLEFLHIYLRCYHWCSPSGVGLALCSLQLLGMVLFHLAELVVEVIELFLQALFLNLHFKTILAWLRLRVMWVQGLIHLLLHLGVRGALGEHFSLELFNLLDIASGLAWLFLKLCLGLLFQPFHLFLQELVLRVQLFVRPVYLKRFLHFFLHVETVLL